MININNLHVNPYSNSYSSSSSEEELNGEVTLAGIPQTETDFKQAKQSDLIFTSPNMIHNTTQVNKSWNTLLTQLVLTLQEAESLIQEIVSNKLFNYLSPINILYLETMKLMHKITSDRTIHSIKRTSLLLPNNQFMEEEINGYQLTRSMSVDLHLLFKALNNYSPTLKFNILHEPKKEIIKANEKYLVIAEQYLTLESIINERGSIESKTLCRKLKQYCDILYHICMKEDFLNRCTQPICNVVQKIDSQEILIPPTPFHMQIYSDSLSICTFSTNLFQMAFKTDLIEPLENALVEIKKFSKKHLNNLQIKNYIESLKEYQLAMDEIYCKFPTDVENTIEQAKKTKSLLALQSCFQNYEKETLPSLDGYEEMHLLILDIRKPWDLLNQISSKIILGMNEKLNKASDKLTKSLQTLNEFTSRKKNVKTPAVHSLVNMVNSITEITNTKKFSDLFEALIIQGIRIPSTACQEMANFFTFIDRLNQDIKTFQQCLLKTQSQLPCSSFSTFQFFFTQIFQFSEKFSNEIEVHSINKNLNKEIFEKIHHVIYKFVNLLNKSVLIKQDMASKCNILEEAYQDLLFLCKKLTIAINLIELVVLDHGEHSLKLDREDHSLKNAVQLLHKCLIKHENSFLRTHIIAMLLQPLSKEDTVSLHDIPHILNLMNLVKTLSKQNNINEHLINLENETKKKLKISSTNSQYFWKLNLKYVTLAKLSIKKLQQIFDQYNYKLQSCQSVDEVLLILHTFNKKFNSFNENSKFWSFQLTMLGLIASQEGLTEISKSLSPIALWSSAIPFFNNVCLKIILHNPLLKKTSPVKTIKMIQPSSDNELSQDLELTNKISPGNENKISSKIPLEFLQETYKASPYEIRLNQLNILKTQQVPLLHENEQLVSIAFRFPRREELIQNCRYYLALVKEQEKWNTPDQGIPLLMQQKGQTEFLLLWEATLKIALSSLGIATKDAPNSHIVLSNYHHRPLIYTHDENHLRSLLNSDNKKGFDKEVIKFSTSSQESQLQRAFWFQEDHELAQEIEPITVCCEKVWDELVHSVKSVKNSHLIQVEKYNMCRTRVHILKLFHISTSTYRSSPQDIHVLKEKITLFDTCTNIDLQCHDLAKGLVKSLERVIDLHLTLTSYGKQDLMPLYFSTRSSEIQVSILSLTIQLALCTIKITKENQPHPIFLDYDGQNLKRPLIHCHHVEKLWEVLKSNISKNKPKDIIKMLDLCLPLFIGDPRYPHPNKSAMTNELVTMHERVYLQQKIEEKSFLTDDDKKLISKHVGDSGWLLSSENQKIILKEKTTKATQVQQEKTMHAFYLATVILDLSNPKNGD